jgi:L-lactate dehydrogenase complex protein LldG
VWLLPPLHVVVLPSPFLYPTLSAFVMAHDLVGHSSHVALVTGPSRTADIEQTLTIGVHGPKQVHIVLLDDAV